MTLIRVDPSLLKGSALRIQGVGQDISSIGSRVLGATQGAPSYDGQFGPRVAALGQQAYSRATNLSSQLENLGSRLYLKGEEFQAVDMEALVCWQSPPPLPESPLNNKSLSDDEIAEFIKNIKDLLKLGGDTAELLASFILAHGAFWGNSYLGQLIIPGSHFLKDLAKLPESLTHIKATNLPGAVRNSSSFGTALNILTIGLTWTKDYFEFRDEGATKVASAIAVDTAIDFASAAVGGSIGASAGAWIGGTIGTVICPGVGTGIGTWIGGTVGRIAGTWVTETIINETGARDGAIDAVSSGIESIGSP